MMNKQQQKKKFDFLKWLSLKIEWLLFHIQTKRFRKELGKIPSDKCIILPKHFKLIFKRQKDVIELQEHIKTKKESDKKCLKK